MNALRSIAVSAVDAAAVLLLSSSVCAQLEPYRVQASASETSFFEINSIRDSANGPSRSFCGFQTPSGSDNLFEFGWSYRLAGDPSNAAFNDDLTSGQTVATPSTFDFGPPIANLNHGLMSVAWTDVDGRGFDADWMVTVEQRAQDEARAIHTLTLLNPGAVPLSIELFLFVDVDVDGAFADDDLRSGAFDGRFVVVDTNTRSFVAVDAQPTPTRYEVDTFGNGLDTRILDDQLAYDLADTGLPFSPGDFVGAMQWSITVPAFSSEAVVLTLGRNLCFNPSGFVGSAANYGTSLGGSVGAPRLASGVPRVGLPYELLVGNGPSNGAVTMLLGSTQTQGTLCGLTVLVDPFVTLDIPLDLVGSGSLTLRTPCEPAINGISIFSQVFAIDFTSSSACFPLVHSDGLQSTFGD